MIRPSSARLAAAYLAAATLLVISTGACTTTATAPSTTAAMSAAAEPIALEQAISDAVGERLNVMPDVAFTKYLKHLPIDDPVRERQAAEAFITKASALGIPTPVSEPVIQAQFVAAKGVQTTLIRGWTDGTAAVPTKQPLDLVTDLRPKIDAATNALLSSMAAANTAGIPSDWSMRLKAAGNRTLPRVLPAVAPAQFWRALAPLQQWPASEN